MSNDKFNELMGIVDGFAKAIKSYDKHYDMKYEREHDCVMAAYRDSAFGILFSLFTQNRITSGEFHRKLHEINTALYNRID